MINILFSVMIAFLLQIFSAQSQNTIVKRGTKYDTTISKHVDKKVIKKIQAKPVAKVEVVLPTPEFINQPYYYDADGNKIIKLENVNALMITKKKTLGLKGAKQFLSMEDASSKIRFTAKKDIVFFIKTTGDVIELTSYIKLYQFVPAEQKREVTITSKEGVLNNKDEAKGKLVNFSVKPISKDNYMIQLPEQFDAGEYGFVWVKNMDLKEFTVFAFGIDWKRSD